jgi:hypothetical protein
MGVLLDVCGRDYVLQTDFSIAHDELKLYGDRWPEMIGPFTMAIDWIKSLGKISPIIQQQDADRQQDIEFIIGPALTVWARSTFTLRFWGLGCIGRCNPSVFASSPERGEDSAGDDLTLDLGEP